MFLAMSPIIFAHIFNDNFIPRIIMIYRLTCLILLVALPSSIVLAQDKKTALVKGNLSNQATSQPASDVQLAIPALKMLQSSDGAGEFSFSQIPYGTHYLLIGGVNMKLDTLRVDINAPLVDLGILSVRPNDAATSVQSIDIPTIALEDNNVSASDDGVGSQNISGVLTASRDPYLNTIAFVFGPYRFQPRGYDRNQQEVQINGAPMNDIETGDAYWNQWGGLNDVFRGRSNIYGLQPSDYAYGGINGTTYFDASAASQRKQTRVTYSLTNRLYRNRLMVTHSSGLLKSGWAYSLSASRRWSQEGYVPGTFYDGYSYYGAITKVINGKHELNFTAFGAPTRRGKSAPAVQEAYDLAGSNFYNPNWGYQNGEKRNAKVADIFQPTYIFNYEYNPTNRTHWNTAIGYQHGKNKNSTLDWYNAADPRPDYYRYLPSWQLINFQSDPAVAQREYDQAAAQWKANESQRQINWDRIYDANRNNYELISSINGNPNDSVLGRRSLYVLSNDVDDLKKFIFNTVLQHAVSEHVTLFTGASFVSQKTESYRQLVDLLGGDFYVNYNQFASRTYNNDTLTQNDLRNPNRIVKVGDKYGYEYVSRFSKFQWWAQSVFTFNKVDFFAAVHLGKNSFSREGLYQNGLYADNSFGKATVQKFTIFGVKGGITYKINGRNYLFVNASLNQDAPTIENTYVSIRTRNQLVDNVQAQKTSSLEGGYLLKAPRVSGRLVGYVTDVKNATEIKRFFNDDPAFQTFVNYALTNMNTRYTGIEFALDIKVTPSLNVTGVASVGQAFYTNRPTVDVYRDNDTVVSGTNRETFIQNYYLSVGPQSAYSLGLNYRSRRYWYASLSSNYFARNYVDINPDRRTAQAGEGITRNSPEWNKIYDQQVNPTAFTLDLFFGKSFLLSKFMRSLPRNTFLYLNVGVNNLLDNQDIRTGGFEQLRYDFADKNPNRYPTKYFYGFGRNFFVNLALKF